MFLSPEIVDEIERFVDTLERAPEPETVLATVLFTDLVGSSERASELGTVNGPSCSLVTTPRSDSSSDWFRGGEIDTAGDGFFASFDGPARAIRCARAITELVHELGLEVRIGVHTGECEIVSGKPTGIAVNTGARVAAAAGAGEVLVTGTVKDLVAGSGISFEDRGERELKGVGAWRLYSVVSALIALIIDAVRSPIGKKNGTLSSIRGDELAAQVLNGLLARSEVDPGEIEDVQLGCVTQIGEQGWNIGRMVPMVAGWPETVPGTTVDRQCGSSMQTNFNAAAAIWSGQLDLVVSGGVEMMSRVPMGSNGGDLSDKLFERWQIVPQGISAEAIAEEWNLSREELDEFSLESHRRAIAAIDEGRFENEIVPVEVQNPHVGTLFAVDETPRRDTSLEALAALSPAFLPEGVVTAGSSSQICDGAAGVLVASERKASELGLEPRARFVSFGLAGVDPYRMLHGNPQACERALAKAGIGWDDVSVIEVNEAFASVVLQFVRDCGLEGRMDDVNPNGGGISLGHPLGATGARITATLVNELERREARYGVATMCIGFGQAIASVIERV